MNHRFSTALAFTLPLLATLTLAFVGCDAAPIDAGGKAESPRGDDDPLDLPESLPKGSFDELHRTILVRSCASQPGLCHSGQFEPNLSTAALAYESLVGRPSLEHPKALRASPGDPTHSLLIDKLRDHGVLSRMPLGEAPLPEAEIAALEQWIHDGALRRPGAAKAPALNNPPREPQIGLFDDQGNRLDGLGPVTVHPGQTITLRMSVEDFETADAKMPIAAVVLQMAGDRQIELAPGAESPGLGLAKYQAEGAPASKGDLLNYHYEWTIGDTSHLVEKNGMITEAPSVGLSFSVIALYADGVPQKGGMITFAILPGPITVQP